MSNLSFIKRIDDLGRIVIPKEIRRKLKIESNENMEISINNDEIIIKKHSLLVDKNKNISFIGNLLSKMSNKEIIITNRDKILFSSNNELLNKEITNELREYIINRCEVVNKNIEIIDNIQISKFISKKIILDSDASGIILMIGDNIEEKDKLLLDVVVELFNEDL